MTGTGNPLVTIAIPVFNGANYLSEAIDSALAQTWARTEVIVIDDGSNDGGETRAIMDRYGARIRSFHKSNGGVSTALNLAIDEMRGDYLSWLSHDDLYDRNKIERQVDALLKLRRTAVCFSDADVVNADGRFIRRQAVGGEDFLSRPLWAVLEARINGCTTLIPRECFENCGRFDPDLPTTQDYDLWFRLALRYPFLHMPEPLIRWRIHERQGSRAAEHLNEVCWLWMDMLTAIPQSTMIEYAGSERHFLERVRISLRGTTYAGAIAGIEQILKELEPQADVRVRLSPQAPTSRSFKGPRRALRRWALNPSVEHHILSGAQQLADRYGARVGRFVGRTVARLYGIHGLIDVPWYRQTYRDVAAAGVDPILHYMRHGWREGRDPSPQFSTSRYLAAHPELIARSASPWAHDLALDQDHWTRPPGPVILWGRNRCWERKHPQRPGILFILHDHGGGTARFAAEIAAAISESVEVVFLRGCGDRAEICRTERGADSVSFPLSTEFDQLCSLLHTLNLKRIVVLHSITLHDHILPLIDRLDLPFDTVLLDYYLAVEQPHLAGDDGRFVGDDRLPAPVWPNDIVRRTLLERADRLIACSRDLAARFARLGIARPIRVAPPPEALTRRRYRRHLRPLHPHETLRVVSLGAIRLSKGRNIMVETARLARERGTAIQFDILGDLYPILPDDVGSLIMVHPDRIAEDLTTKLCRIRPHVAWFPFQVPETYSYVLSDAMSQGLPIIASAIGAVPDRLASWPYSWLHRWDAPPDEWLDIFIRLRASGFLRSPESQDALETTDEFYSKDFVSPLFEDHPREVPVCRI